MMTIEKYMKELVESKSEVEVDAKFHVDWLNGYRENWMSDEQWLLALFFCRLFRGFHHTPPIRKCGNRSICVNTRKAYFSTCDFDYLTKAVIMAHNWGVRMEVGASGPGMIKIQLWKRYKREGSVNERVPTIEEMVEKYKDY